MQDTKPNIRHSISCHPEVVGDATNHAWRIVPSGDRCLVIEFDSTDIASANRVACDVANCLIVACLPGVTDIVACMVSVGIHYEPAVIAHVYNSLYPWDTLTAQVKMLISDSDIQEVTSELEVVIPVCYGGEFGEDLTEVARALDLTAEEVVNLHSGYGLSVLMIGFAPGHPYIGMLDERLAIPRRATPRKAVPSGSIGLANCQTVVYPMTLPSGWSLIGRTPLKLFDPHGETPCLLSPGDRVRFQPITEAEFMELKEQQEAAHDH